MATEQTIAPAPGEHDVAGQPTGSQPPHAPREQRPDAQNPDAGRPDAKKPKGPNFLILAIIVVALIVLFFVGLLPRLSNTHKIRSEAHQTADAKPSVQVMQAQRATGAALLNLPGNIQAVQQTSINARASGYLKKIYADIGDRVVAGELLAVIQTPETDQDVLQSRAQLAGAQAQQSQAAANLTGQIGNLDQARANLSRAEASLAQAVEAVAQQQAQVAQSQQAAAQTNAQLTQAQANRDLARVTAQRYQNLVTQGATDQQSADQATVSFRTNEANVSALSSSLGASQANVRAFQAAVRAGEANVKAYQDGVVASRAAVATAAANVTSSRASLIAAAANVRSAQAALERSITLQAYAQVRAPFSGIITARNVDSGALISAGGAAAGTSQVGTSTVGANTSGTAASGGSSGGTTTSAPSSTGTSTTSASSGGASSSLFSIAQINLLRIYVNVPQTYFTSLRVGLPAVVTVRELPQRSYNARVTRTSSALDPTSRTLVAEIELPNPSGELRPGMFAQVAFHVPQTKGILIIPDGALIYNGNGTQVAVVTPQNKIHFQQIAVGRDFGETIQVISGLKPTDEFVAIPFDGLVEGMSVQIAPDKSGKGQAGGKSGGQGGKGGSSKNETAEPENQLGGNGSSSLPPQKSGTKPPQVNGGQ